ncbi:MULTISPECIES: cytochrome c [Paraburkholderia]|jgi:alcohol dehydrogenase (quinone), cytochrome c subunit|uniref:Cytochrome c, mono-and diheme variants n=1 Tax=Paraburkholderia phenazinium TaxID=60549 RepID=A0A1N6JGV5_9BURK|nr:Cytochrome c, mono-and diheme variants [Paraburkholderia phenazinium]SIO49591.1 Cytochrome c, mono-and diheme variants [Paraburkholderia phenazinium]
MTKYTKRVLPALASVVMSSLALGLAALSTTVRAQDATSADMTQLIRQGAYLAQIGDCVACHTAKDGKPFAGGLPMSISIGTIWSSNITPDKDTGIGSYTLDDFDRAVRHGIAKNGETLYPAMPYPSYAKVKPSNIKALYAYFMHGVQPVSQANKTTDIMWPMSMRWPLSVWRKLYAPDVVTDDTPVSATDPVLRGRYLVEGLAHCSACHTPRKVTMQEASLSDDGSTFLSGTVIDGYLAENLRGDVKDGLGNWSEGDIVAFLKSGRNEHSAAFGGMAEVVQDSTQFMMDSDLMSIATYLKTLGPAHPDQTSLTYDSATEKMFHDGSASSNGAIQFLNNCAACHRTTGNGWNGTFPRLALSTTVNTKDPSSLIRIVLSGAQMPWTASAPTHYAMPGFADRLSDQDLADVLTFVRSSWGNTAPAVTSEMVAAVRKSLPEKAPATDLQTRLINGICRSKTR